MPAWPGEGCTPGQLPAPWLVAPFSLFLRRAWPQKQGLYRLWPSAHRWHTPPHSPLRSQTEAFHGFKSSTRSSSHRRLEWVTESYSGKKRHSDLLSQQKFPALGSPWPAEAAQPESEELQMCTRAAAALPKAVLPRPTAGRHGTQEA